MRFWLSLLCILVSGRCLANTDLTDLIANVSSIQAEEEIPAVGLVIIKRGEVQFANALGIVNARTQTPVDQQTMFRLGSISKSFAGLAALKARELGLFSLTDKVSDYLGEDFLDNPWRETDPVRIVHLLEHTAGFFDITSTEFGHDSKEPISLVDAFELSPESRSIKWQPGMHSSYSNLGAPILAHIIEKQSGLSYEDFVAQHVLQPLQMHHSSFFHDEYVQQHLVAGHRRDGQTVIPYWNIAYRPFGALNADPGEMAHFLQMMIDRGRFEGANLFSDSDMRRMETPASTLASRYGLTHGYGLGVYADAEKSAILHGHGGTAAGHVAEYRYSSEHRLGYLVAINVNNKSALGKITRKLKEYLLKDMAELKVEGDNVVTDTNLSEFEGYYRTATARQPAALLLINSLTLRRAKAVDGMLVLSSLFGAETRLTPVSGHLFKDGDSRVATAAVITEDGVNYVQTSERNLIQTSALRYWISLLMLAFVLLSFAVTLLVGPAWLLARLAGKARGGQSDSLVIVPLIVLGMLVSPILISLSNTEIPSLLWLQNHAIYLYIAFAATALVLAYISNQWRVSNWCRWPFLTSCAGHLIVTGVVIAVLRLN